MAIYNPTGDLVKAIDSMVKNCKLMKLVIPVVHNIRTVMNIR